MRLMMRLCIILMPRSLCVCVHLGVTFTLIFIINYYHKYYYHSHKYQMSFLNT